MNSITIPKIIHQVWIGHEPLPENLQPLIATWKEYHPDWDYILWDDLKSKMFISEYFPAMLPIYNGYDTDVQRADAIRYMILYEIGGVYVDLDFECFRNLEQLLNNRTCVFSEEPLQHCINNNKPVLVGNAFIASVPRHRFMLSLIHEVENTRHAVYEDYNTTVMESTGPYMVTRLYLGYQHEDLTLLGPDHVFPLTKDEISEMLTSDVTKPDLQRKLDNASAVHYWINSWTK